MNAAAGNGPRFLRTANNAFAERYEGKYYAVAGSGRARAISLNEFVTLTGSADADGTALVDGTTAADTANGSGALIPGMVVGIQDSAGRPLRIQYLDTSTAGRVQVTPPRNAIFAITQSAADTHNTGSAKLLPGTITNFNQNVTDDYLPQPVNNDTLDVSTYNATVTQHALQILGPVGAMTNLDVTSPREMEIKINDTWIP